jgi:AraC-like DNA-binding protein
MIRHAYTTQSVRLKGFSAEQLLEVVRSARLEHYILSNASCDAQLDRWSLGDFTVDVGRYSFAVRAVGAFHRQRLCIGYMRNLSGPTWVNGWTADDSTVEFYPDGAELNYCAAPHGQWVAIEFTESALQAAACERLGLAVELPWKDVMSFHVSEPARQLLDQMVRRLWAHPISGALMVGPILGAVAGILHAHSRRAPAKAVGKYQHRQLLLKRSDEYLKHNFARPFQLGALATAVGTTPRTLQRVFDNAYGVTPQKWARYFALHQARRHLQSIATQRLTVEGIARECGFRHMGRFAEYYRTLFGELPSLTKTNGHSERAVRSRSVVES